MDSVTSSNPSHSETRLLVVLVEPDDHRRAGIAFWLASEDFNVQPFESVAELFASPRPAGLVLIADEGDSLTELLTHPMATEYSIPFIAYSGKIEVQHVVQAMRRGAIDYVEWPDGKADLAKAVRNAGSRWQTLDWPHREAHTPSNQPHALTRRELEVLHCLREGMTSRQAAERLAISVRTVDIYCGNIRRKFGVHRISDAIAMFNASQAGEGTEAPANTSRDPLLNVIDRQLGPAYSAGDEDSGKVLDAMERKALAQARLARLTKRETEVLTQVANGLPNWKIAEKLNISRRTVETHRYNLLDKIEMRNMALAIRLAAEGGLV